MKRKIVFAIAAVALMLTAMPVTVFAHGHSSSNTASTKYSLCSVENCNTIGTHEHNSINYYGHYVGDGHDYHELCSVQGCTLTTDHQHDEVTCLPHTSGDGHGYHNSNHSRGRHH